MFENLVWQDDRVLHNGLVFRLQHYRNDNWELGDECFVFYKIKKLVDQYEHFFASRNFECRRFFELGLWEGGGLAFWYETLKPDKIVGIDLADKTDSNYFRRYVAERGLQDRLKTFWRVDQSDSQRLTEIVTREFDGPLDLILDDASHIYEPTLSSFQTLFHFLRPGGFYIIEDWAWEHWPACHGPDYSLSRHKGLTELVCQLVQAAGTSESLVRSATIFEGFAAIERSNSNVPETFKLEDYIVRRPKIVRENPVMSRVKRKIRKVLSGK